ncbi:ABC1 kinase family protein [Micromonospora sp. LOL_021]|uniref:ABC1 kinase family protein n=1 Tax=Micromonospora sp. LOL_021 TaxID=3345417 RepID=UPI003A85AC7D
MAKSRWYDTGARAVQVTGVALRHGLAAVPSVVRAASGGSAGIRAVRDDRLRLLVTDLGASYVKAAQLLSTRRDLLPESLCAAFGRLHDQVPPMRQQLVQTEVRAAYRDRPWPFVEFDWTPIASGSIACVYRSRLVDGREVAVKVRRPGIGARMAADFALLGAGARAIGRVPRLRRMPAATIVAQIRDAVLRQLDFGTEAQALNQLRENLDDLDFLRVPQALPEVSADGVLVMEYLPGLRRIDPDELSPELAELAVRRVLHCVYRMLFLDGVVHCDLHPGNLYIDQSGDLALLDAGFVVRLQPRVRRLFAEFFFNMSRGNGKQCADIVVRSTADQGREADLPRFRKEITELVEATHNRRIGEFKLGPFAARLFDLQRRCGLYAAPEFIFPLLSLLVIEGMINEFDAAVDFQAEAKPVLIKSLLTAVPIEPAVS